MALDLQRSRLAVTGGAGMLGQSVLRRLQEAGCTNLAAPRSRDFDLRTASGVQAFYDTLKPDVVIHLAAVVGGIGANCAEPGRFFYDNAIMGLQLMEQGRQVGLRKFVCIGTVCSYPKLTPTPFKESDLWNGYPEPTSAPYALAKKMLLIQAQAYRQQYDFNAIYLIPVNLYGPHDNFSLHTSHVVPAIIRKCIEAKLAGQMRVELWGDGTPTREFLYAADAAEGIVLATLRYDGGEPVNLGSGEEVSIRELAQKVARISGYEGEFVWNDSMPKGQARRCVDTSRAKSLFGFEARTSFEEGLRATCQWYMAHRQQIIGGAESGP